MQEDSRDPAPALGRGLAILDHLALNGASSLERLCAVLALPKSSGLRILESLQLAGAVHRDPSSKRYRALLRLGPVEAADAAMQQAAARFAERLSDTTACVCEIYALRDGLPFMVDRYVPDDFSDSMSARIGYLRELEEIEAITQVAYAWGEAEVAALPHWWWNAQGEREPVDLSCCQRLISKARRSGCGIDVHPNEAQVRRYAAPLLTDQSTLRGILVLAEGKAARTANAQLAEDCRQCAADISRALDGGSHEIHR